MSALHKLIDELTEAKGVLLRDLNLFKKRSANLEAENTQLREALRVAREALNGCLQDSLFYAEQVSEAGSQGRTEGWHRIMKANHALAAIDAAMKGDGK